MLLLKTREELITAKVAKEHTDGTLRSEILFLKDRVSTRGTERGGREGERGRMGGGGGKEEREEGREGGEREREKEGEEEEEGGRERAELPGFIVKETGVPGLGFVAMGLDGSCGEKLPWKPMLQVWGRCYARLRGCHGDAGGLQVVAEQQEKTTLEETLSTEISSLQEQLGKRRRGEGMGEGDGPGGERSRARGEREGPEQFGGGGARG